LPSNLLDWLNGLVLALEPEHDSISAFEFGARTISISGLDGAPQPQLRTNLIQTSTRSANHRRISLLSRQQIDEMPPVEAKHLGAYGKVLNTIGISLDEWLVTIEPETKKFMALHLPSLNAFYFAGSKVPPREVAEFCRPLLHWMSILDGNVVVHAAAIGHKNRAILVSGEGNSGKTTLSRLCLEAGMTYLGDNVVEVAITSNGALVYGAYPSFKIRPSSTWPISDSWPSPTWDDEANKDIYLLADSTHTGFTSGPLNLVATLALNPTLPSRIEPQAVNQTFFSMAPNTVAQFPYFERQVLQRVNQVSRTSPTFASGYLDQKSLAHQIMIFIEGFE
jgi:hypothetical protein